MAIATPYDQPGASIPGLVAGQVDALGLMQRPTLLVPVPNLSAARLLIGGLGILCAAVFRESGTALTGQAFINVSSSGGAQANTVTLPAGGVGVTTWVTGFEVTGMGATAQATLDVTLGGVSGAPLHYVLLVPAGVTTEVDGLTVELAAPGIPANAANTAITLTVPSFGAGNTNAAATIHGYQQTIGSPLGAALAAPVVTADLLDGLDAGGEILAPLDLPPFGLYSQGLGAHGPVFTRGLFLNVTAGTMRGAVYVKI